MISLDTLALFKNKSESSSGKSYIQANYGNTVMVDAKKSHPSSYDNLNKSHDLGAGSAFTIGKKFNYTAIELFYADLGKTGTTYKDKYTVEKTAHIVGGGIHWMLWFLDLKFGIGTARGRRKYLLEPASQSTLNISPDNSKINSSVFYFGFGFNFNLSPTTEFVLESIGYGFKEKSVTFTENGSQTIYPAPNDKPLSGAIGLTSIGLRFYF